MWVAPSLFRSSVGTFSKKPTFVGKLKQLRVSVGTSEANHFCVGNIKTKTSFENLYCLSLPIKAGFFEKVPTDERKRLGATHI